MTAKVPLVNGKANPVFHDLAQLNRTRDICMGLPVERKAGFRAIPWGYRVDPSNDEWLIPVEEQFRLLREAKRYLQESSFDDVAAWIAARADRPITAGGLHYIMARRPPFPESALPTEEKLKLCPPMI